MTRNYNDKIYITFGQLHRHEIDNKLFDKDCVAVIACTSWRQGIDLAFDIFGQKWATHYEHERIMEIIDFYPRGFIPVNFQDDKA